MLLVKLPFPVITHSPVSHYITRLSCIASLMARCPSHWSIFLKKHSVRVYPTLRATNTSREIFFCLGSCWNVSLCSVSPHMILELYSQSLSLQQTSSLWQYADEFCLLWNNSPSFLDLGVLNVFKHSLITSLGYQSICRRDKEYIWSRFPHSCSVGIALA